MIMPSPKAELGVADAAVGLMHGDASKPSASFSQAMAAWASR